MFNFKLLFWERKCALRETGGGNIYIRVSKLDCMDFSSVNGLSCITSENQLVSTLLQCRTEKIWGKRTLDPKSMGMWKSEPSEDKWQIMFCNLYTDSMQQSRHNFFEQNRLLMKISAKKCSSLGSPSQQDINNKWDERDRVFISFIPW